ncbi:MAG TPA: hypothetical protein VI434_06400 [Candidatus Dormibacteraeota bacterium]
MTGNVKPDLARELRQAHRCVDALEEDSEFIATHTRDAKRRSLSEGVAESLSGVQEHVVAKVESVSGVDAAQTFDIDEHDPIRFAARAATRIHLALKGHELLDGCKPGLPIDTELRVIGRACHA